VFLSFFFLAAKKLIERRKKKIAKQTSIVSWFIDVKTLLACMNTNQTTFSLSFFQVFLATGEMTFEKDEKKRKKNFILIKKVL
jgi:hypothetical protein